MTHSKKEEAIIFGTLLGDGHLNKRGNSYRLKIHHSIEQKEYVLWKHKQLIDLCKTTRFPKEEIRMSGIGKNNKSVVFYTASSILFKKYDDLFYSYNLETNRRTKKITEKLIESIPMDPLVLAVWYLDDGSIRNDMYSGKFATQGYTKEENQLLRIYLKKWDIDSNLVKHSDIKQQYYIYIPSRSFGKLISYIESIVEEIPDLVYKLNKNKKPRNDSDNK